MTRVAAIVLLLLATLVAGCGDDGPDVLVLDGDQVQQALLTEDNLPAGFAAVPDDDEDDAPEMGCLDVLDETEGPAGEAEAEVTYSIDDGQVSVGSYAESFASVEGAVDSIDTGRRALAGCTRVDETDERGVRLTLDIEMDEDRSVDDADEQINVTVTGAARAQGAEIPFALWFSVVRIDNHLTRVATSDFTADPESLLQPYLEIAVDRLTAVVAGEEPPATQGPGPAVPA